MVLQLADGSMAYLKGIIEDVLTKVGKFVTPAEFIVLDFNANEQLPIILGRPCLATGAALIDVREDTLKIRVEDEDVVFDIFKSPTVMSQYKDLCMINVIKVDKCGVVSPPKTFLDYLIEQPKLLHPKPNLILIDELKKAKVEESTALKNSHPREVKIIKKWPPNVRKKMKEFG
ncbi:uncharacterized protein LOC124886637 [Capsicum annuum]|uniref:uncharacterized protein LOC124886637 n=1 Tax=Capsicum annuum TaxID=4072 RepID=UPI001FB0C552|nr:uncharacterized protein LOC124886637 [Capsicum annuum]